MIYSLVNPSDTITFLADDDKIAFLCAFVIGSGQYGCENIDTGKDLKTLLLFDPNHEKTIDAFLGESNEDFVKKNLLQIAECFDTFAYVSPSKRIEYDKLISQYNGIELSNFKKAYEDKNRSSMNKIVLKAWNYADSLRKKAKTLE